MQWIAVALLCVVRTAEVDGLVEGLHDPDFQVREAAAAKIERLGCWAVLGLERGLQHNDPEVRHRCVRLLELAQRSDLEVGLAALLDDPERPEAKRLPGWERFRQRYGQDLDARTMFATMFRTSPQLMLSVEDGKDLLERTTALATIIEGPENAVPVVAGFGGFGARLLDGDSETEIHDRLAALLFAATELQIRRLGDEDERRIALARTAIGLRRVVREFDQGRLRNSPTFRELTANFLRTRVEIDHIQLTVEIAKCLDLDGLIEGTLKPAVVRLANALPKKDAGLRLRRQLWATAGNLEWQAAVRAPFLADLRTLVEAAHTGGERIEVVKLRTEALTLAGEVEPSEGAPLALDLLADPRLKGSVRADAIQYLCRLGRSDFTEQLEALLRDPTSHEWTYSFDTQLRDVALAALVFRSGQSLEAYGFHQEANRTPADDSSRCVGFADEAARTAALERWGKVKADRRSATQAATAVLQADPCGAALLRRLGSDSWTEREQAVERLRQFGPRVAPLLKAGLEDADPEVAERCRRLLEP